MGCVITAFASAAQTAAPLRGHPDNPQPFADGSGEIPRAEHGAGAGAAFPVKLSANGRYLEDRNGRPFLLHGDTGWSLIVQLTQEDAEAYLEDRRQKGFNSTVVNLLEYYYASNPPKNVDGAAPFTTPGDFATPDEAYFAHADWVLSKAGEKGILVLLNPCYLGYEGGRDGWWREVEANGPAKCRDYGRFLGNRYKDYDNIIWVAGGDQTPPAGSPRERNWLEILRGIKDHAPKHLWTGHWDNKSDSLDVPAFRPYMDLNGVYAYETVSGHVHQRALRAYHRPDFKPIYLWESWYEGLNWKGFDTPPAMVRRQAYEALLSGATGQNFGSNHIWSFGARTHSRNLEPDVDWRAGMEKPGSLDMVRLKQLFASRAWWKLVPDHDHTVVTAGYGTVGTNDYVTAARAGDGSLVMAYLPNTGTGTRTLTVDMTKLSGSASGKWFNPTSGVCTTISGSPFANDGARKFTASWDNGTGTNDWVLVLETAAASAENAAGPLRVHPENPH